MKGRVITLIGIALLLGAGAAPASAERSLLPRPITLRGSAPSWETTFAGAGTPRLDLRYEASDLLERGSLLTVMVDGVPRATRPLRPLGRLVVRLGELGEGFHQVTVRARLRVADDPCLREHDDEAWIRIDGATLRGLDEAPAETTVLGWFEERQGSSVVVKAPGRPAEGLDPDWAAAILDGHITHWRRGIGHGAESGAIVLEVGPAGEGVARASVVDGDLHVTAPGPLALQAGLRALWRDGVARRCPATGCILGTVQPVLDGDRRPEGSQVTTLSELGFARGWRAQGEGRHLLRFGWDRPADWRPVEWPVVELAVRAPEVGFDGDRSRATLEINSVPVASWSVRPGESRWRARVPKALWTDGRWEMSVSLTLRAEEDGRCHRDDDELWVHVDGSSGLSVPREELRFGGLAAARDRFRGAPLVWNEGLEASTLATAAAALAPLADAEPWRWLAPDAACESPCIRLDAAGERLALVGDEGARQWRDERGDLEIPLLPAEHTLLVERANPETLVIRALGMPEGLTAPSWSGLLGDIALFHDGAWDPLHIDERPGVERTVAPAPTLADAQPSMEEVRTRWVDLAFLSLAALLLATMGVRSLRRRREVRS